MRFSFPIILALGCAVSLPAAPTTPANSPAAKDYVPFEGARSTWHDGFDRYDFVMDEKTLAIEPFVRPAGENFAVGNPPTGKRRCVVIVPRHAAAGQPWSWRGCYWDHEPQTEVELLRRGFHVAFVTPDPGLQWNAWYTWLTARHGLSKKPAFIGMSKGGVNEYDWTTVNPDKVSCIYADNPAIRPTAFAKLDELARHDVPLLNVCGSVDFLLQHHTLKIEDRYLQLGGRITVMIKEGQAHHPHSLRNPKFIADWIERHSLGGPDPRPDFAGEEFVKSYYYSLEKTNVWIPEFRTFASCRGPGFVDCYDRYDESTSSQWGLTGLAVIVPHTVAPEKPWVFRADAIQRDDAIDQALLARGYHIVIPPLTAQSGPVQKDWDAAYQLMVAHGFSTRPVMEGTGAGAGEAYAWAIENPDKVTCIVGRNPALRSLMVKSQPLDHLDVLAKAGVPLLHVCDANDPWFKEYTEDAERRYRELGGKITVIVNDAHSQSTGVTNVAHVVDFITASNR